MSDIFWTDLVFVMLPEIFHASPSASDKRQVFTQSSIYLTGVETSVDPILNFTLLAFGSFDKVTASGLRCVLQF